jgi:hypothetical protein
MGRVHAAAVARAKEVTEMICNQGVSFSYDRIRQSALVALLLAGLTVSLPAPTFADEHDPATAVQEATQDAGIDAETGTDPRDFAPKFMPYYRYSELENDLEEHQMTVFGLYAFTPKFAMTYEIPLAMHRDVGDTNLRDPVSGDCGNGRTGGPPVLPGGIEGEGDCKETGIGDMNLRFMYAFDREFLGADWIAGSQLNFPTASDAELGSETFSVGPMVAPVWDLSFWPGPGAFAAMMNFYFFDVWKDGGREDQSYWLGRWFFMLPLRAPGPGIFDGIYMLPEMQPMYDFEEKHFSFWIGPELGKILAPGFITYAKPGFGVDPDSSSGDRDFTFEFGFRYFMD